jgi:hypothetical protein
VERGHPCPHEREAREGLSVLRTLAARMAALHGAKKK